MSPTDRDDPMGGFDMHLGPGLDRLFPIRLSDGRLASVVSFSVQPSNWGILEGGSNARCNERQQASWIELVRKRHEAPIHVIPPPVTKVSHLGRYVNERIPWMSCAASLVSSPMDPEMTQSHLTLVWWQDPWDASLRQWIERAAAGLNWDAVAEDWDFF